MEDFKQIVVSPGKPVIIKENPTSYPLIGKGLQGAVFKVSDEQCVKIYSKKIYCSRDAFVLQEIGKKSSIVPNVYEIGKKYILMEYLNGSSLQEELEQTGKMTEQICRKILDIIQEQIRCQFPRIDFALRHAIYDQYGSLKVIDHVNSFRVNRQVPTRLLKDLKQIGLKSSFLNHVKTLEPHLYQQWNSESK